MANWAWPHTPASNLARIVLVGGPFDGEEAAFVPPDTAAPVQVVWSRWFPWGFSAYLYEWRGETVMDRGRTDALVFRSMGRQVVEVPPVIAQDADVWARGAALLVETLGFPGLDNLDQAFVFDHGELLEG